MKFTRPLFAAAIGISLTIGSIAPAEARPRGWSNGGWHDNGRYNNGRYNNGWRRHRGDGFGLGDAIGVAAIIGAVAVVANSVSKNRDAARSSDPDYRPDPQYDQRDDGRPIASEDSAVDSCATAAREEATVSGGYAEIRQIGAPQPIDGGYNIDGEVERRGAYSDAAGETRRFTCTVRDDQVTDVYLSRDLVSN